MKYCVGFFWGLALGLGAGGIGITALAPEDFRLILLGFALLSAGAFAILFACCYAVSDLDLPHDKDSSATPS